MNLNIPGYCDFELLHEGRNSRVFRARQRSDNQQVAIKTPSSLYPSGVTLAIFNKEFHYLHQTLSSISQIPKGLKLIDIDTSIAVVMEYSNGISLKRESKKSPLTLQESASVFVQASKVLQQLHDKNIIHQDINSSNILYHRTSHEITLIDFGSACNLPLTPTPISPSDPINGTFSYLSPEQTGRINRPIDFRSDIYAFGIMMYEMLTGRLPFDTQDITELVHCHIAKKPSAVSELMSNIPNVLNDIVMRCLEKDPSERYQSASGLHHDLSKCLHNLQDNDKIKTFTLGLQDISSRLLFPQKLYGREQAFATLKQYYQQAITGKNAFVLVSGEPGVGKTSIVRELNRTIAIDYGYIINGKYEQYNRSQPYSGLIQAFSSLIKQILTESDDRVLQWKKRITDCLGINSGFMIELIPALAVLVNQSVPRQTLQPSEAKTLIRRLFLELVQTFGTHERPIVVFLDDLQWIDSASLELIELFGAMREGSQIFFVGAYRDNEVESHHPLRQMIHSLIDKNVKVAELTLKPLEKSGLQDFLADTLSNTTELVSPLVEVLYQKTLGNPLFFRTLILELYESREIAFDIKEACWHWDLKAIKKYSYAINVVDAIKKRINSLPQDSQETLQLAACIGGTFSMDLIVQLSQLDRQQVAERLAPAITQSLIVTNTHDFSLYSQSQALPLDNITCHFTHDRIQQAAYNLLPVRHRPEQHLKLGRILLQHQHSPKEEHSSSLLFDIADHMEKAISLISDPDEKATVAALLVQAGHQAKHATAFADAVHLLRFAHQLQSIEWWQQRYRLTCDIHLEYAEALSLHGEYTQAEAIQESIIKKAKTPNDKIRLYHIQSKQYHFQARFEEAISIEIQALNLLGVKLPTTDEQLTACFHKESQTINTLLAGHEPKTYAKSLEENSHSDYIHILELLFSLFVDSYLVGRSQLSYTISAIMARLSLERGNNVMTSIAFINYGSTLCSLGEEYRLGYAFGELAMALADRYQSPAQQNYTYHVFSLGINHWQSPLTSSHRYWQQASKLALASGSPYAGYVFLQLSHILLASNTPLDKAQEQIRISREFLISNNLVAIQTLLLITVEQPVKHLLGETLSIQTLDDDNFNTHSHIEQFQDMPFFLGCLYYSMLRVDCLSGNLLSIEELNKRIELVEATQQGQITLANSLFYYSLLLVESYRAKLIHSQEDYTKTCNVLLERVARWAELCQANFEHKTLLLRAELQSDHSPLEQAIDMYDEAIYAALEQHFYEDAALAAEKTAKYWLRHHKPTLAKPYLEQACAYYSRWGSTGMNHHIRSHYTAYLDVEDKKYTIDTVHTSQGESTLKSQQLAVELDLNTVIKATQAISQHMRMSELGEKLVHIAMENAGATQGLLIKKDSQGHIIVEAGLKKDQNTTKVIDPSNRNVQPEHIMSTAVVSYVFRTGVSLVLDNAVASETFASCPYIQQHHIASICCVPIKRQDKVLSLLYLEHESLPDTFRSERLQTIEILTTQATISMENSRVYQELSDLNHNLENMVNERTLELQEKNEALRLMSITDQLTGLNNRRLIEETLQRELGRYHRYNHIFAVIIFDIDHFKKINDIYGHNAGDSVLKTFSNTVKSTIRKTDIAGRWGGEEFILIITDDPEASPSIAERLRVALEKIVYAEIGKVTASFGVAICYPDDTLSSLIKRSDDALYRAKENGRNRVEVGK